MCVLINTSPEEVAADGPRLRPAGHEQLRDHGIKGGHKVHEEGGCRLVLCHRGTKELTDRTSCKIRATPLDAAALNLLTESKHANTSP